MDAIFLRDRDKVKVVQHIFSLYRSSSDQHCSKNMYLFNCVSYIA